MAVAQLGLDLAVGVKVVHMAEGAVGAFGAQVVAGQSVVVFGAQGRNNGAVADEPGVVVERAAVGFQVVEAHAVLVPLADAPAEGWGDAFLVDLGAPVVGLVRHDVQTQGRVLARDPVEVPRQAALVAAAQGEVHLVFLQQLGRLVDLVDHAASRAFAKQHGRRSLEHFDAVLVEGVALDQRGVAQAVHIDVARLPE